MALIPTKRRSQKRAGYTLLELLIAASISVFGIMSIGAFFQFAVESVATTQGVSPYTRDLDSIIRWELDHCSSFMVHATLGDTSSSPQGVRVRFVQPDASTVDLYYDANRVYQQRSGQGAIEILSDATSAIFDVSQGKLDVSILSSSGNFSSSYERKNPF